MKNQNDPSVACGNQEEEVKDPSVACGDSSPIRGAFSEEPPVIGKVAQSAGGVSSPRKGIFTIDDVRKRGLIWDGHWLPYNPNLVKYARSLRKSMTTAERKLWYDFLRDHDTKFYRQRPIDHFIADFYCSQYALIIEIDGSQHYTPEGLKRDAVRTDILSVYGLEIIRFTNDDVIGNFNSVCRAINGKVQRGPLSRLC